jgi:hypothetical protein
MQKQKLSISICTVRGMDIYSKNYSSWFVDEYVFANKSEH